MAPYYSNFLLGLEVSRETKEVVDITWTQLFLVEIELSALDSMYLIKDQALNYLYYLICNFYIQIASLCSYQYIMSLFLEHLKYLLYLIKIEVIC